MSLLRNPFVVGALTLAAVILVVLNATRFRPRPLQAARTARHHSQPPPLSPGTNAVQDVTPEANPVSEKTLLPLELASIQTNVSRWIQSPRRDPFRSRFEPQTQAARLLNLKAIWRQSGGNVAVVNDTLVSEGDKILEFSIEKIEPDRVWVLGPNGREELRFRPPGARSKSPLPPAVTSTDGRH